MTKNETTNEFYHSKKISLKDLSGFAEHKENATHGLGYKLTLQRTSEDHVEGPESETAAANLTSEGRVSRNVNN